MKKIFFLAIFILICFYSTFGCSLNPNPLKKFNANEFIFYGEVIGYTPIYTEKEKETEKTTANSFSSDKTRKTRIELKEPYKSWLNEKKQVVGLIVKVSKSVYMPESTTSLIEILPFSLMGSCDYQGTYKNESAISREFPIGSKIKVTGKKSYFFPKSNEKENTRIDILIFDILARSYDQTKDFVNEFDTKFDYINNSQFRKFELKIDLFRLEFSNSYRDSLEILERLSSYSDKYEIDMNYEMIVRNYLNGIGDIEKLLNLRKEFVEKTKINE
jgi:hypothetical protein